MVPEAPVRTAALQAVLPFIVQTPSPTMIPSAQDLWFLPLGGCGEIGMNMNLYGHDGHWLMVDCGVTFRDPVDAPRSGFDVQMADPAFIEATRERLSGILLTHAHEDHIGALPWLWPRLRCPVYATAFTAEMLRRKLIEHGLERQVPVHLVDAGDRLTLDGFDIQWVANAHSIPDPCALYIRTAAGSVFHTADWKLDEHQQIGHGYSADTYRAIGTAGVDALVCDSTAALTPGRSVSEGDLYDGLLEQVGGADGRVIVACFGSNIARLSTLGRVASATGRHMGLLGRSLINTVSAARTVGLWPEHQSLVEPAHLGYLPADGLLLVATGSQGEPRTALDRLSRNRFRDLELSAGDTVLFSARVIPGNESAVAALIERLEGIGIKVIRPETVSRPIHASGHPAADELRDLYRWTRPTLMIPVHGETVHMTAQTRLARESGVARRLLGCNGDLFMIAPHIAIRRGAARVGRLGVGKKKLEVIVSTGPAVSS